MYQITTKNYQKVNFIQYDAKIRQDSVTRPYFDWLEVLPRDLELDHVIDLLYRARSINAYSAYEIRLMKSIYALLPTWCLVMYQSRICRPYLD